MEDKKLNEKESLELISQMIRNTQQRMVRSSGSPFLIWGYTTIGVAVLVYFLVANTGNHAWNWLWFLIPIVGWLITWLTFKKQESGVKTYIDRIVLNTWLIIGSTSILLSLASFFISLPILFINVLLISLGASITGMVIRFKPILFSGFLGIVLSFLCLFISYPTVILVFALIFLIMMVIPGHILNYKSRKSDV